MIEVKECTMLYPSKKGIMDVTFTVNKGEIFGYLGPNGAGKTTTIRALMGFMKVQSGEVRINGLDCWTSASLIQKELGYIPGEMALFDDMTGNEFFRFMLQMRGIKDTSRLQDLPKLFELDPKSKIRKMSKGMKQKVGIITAFMHDPKIYILDEPSSGLDPLMQQVFADLVLEEKKRGKTILMSSHSFEEVDKTCDRVAMIKEGRIAIVEDIEAIKQKRRKVYELKVDGESDVHTLRTLGLNVRSTNVENVVEVVVEGSFKPLLEAIKQIEVEDLNVKNLKLEDIFMDFYGKGGNGK